MATFPAAVATDTNLYLAANNLSTTLSADITSGATSIPVTSTTGFPASGFISIDDEIIHYSAIADSTHFTADTRGADSTTAAAHSSNSSTTSVYHNVIAAHHNVLKDEVIAIETMLNAKLGTSSSAYTVSRAIASNASGILVVSATTDTELGYLSGVTSAIQTQITAKAMDSLVVHLAGSEAISGTKTFNAQIQMAAGLTSSSSGDVDVTRGSLKSGGVAGFRGTLQLSSDPNSVSASLKIFAPNSGNAGVIQVVAAAIASGAVPTYTYTIPDSATNASFVMTEGAQTINGNKTGAGTWDISGLLKGKGTATNDNAASGYIGEYISSSVALASAVTLSTVTAANITSITLTAGDWDVDFSIGLTNNASLNWVDFGTSTTSATFPASTAEARPDGAGNYYLERAGTFNTSTANCDFAGQSQRISASTSTTIYLVVKTAVASGTAKAFGFIGARRAC